MAKEKDYTAEQDALFAKGRFCDKCAKEAKLVEQPGAQMKAWYGQCDNCGDKVILPGPGLYYNGVDGEAEVT